MPDPLYTTSYSKARIARPVMTIAAVAFGLGLFAATAPASAAALGAATGLATPGLTVEDVGYKRRKAPLIYTNPYYVPNAYVVQDPKERYMPFGGSDEIRELQRAYPSTLWPPSMRY